MKASAIKLHCCQEVLLYPDPISCQIAVGTFAGNTPKNAVNFTSKRFMPYIASSKNSINALTFELSAERSVTHAKISIGRDSMLLSL